MAIEVNIVKIFIVDKYVDAIVWSLPSRNRMFTRKSLARKFKVAPRQREFSKGVLPREFPATPRQRMFGSVREKG